MILNAPVYCLGLGFPPVHANNNYPQNYLALTIKQDCVSGPDGRKCKSTKSAFLLSANLAIPFCYQLLEARARTTALTVSVICFITPPDGVCSCSV
jgi:hypothetical protein